MQVPTELHEAGVMQLVPARRVSGD